MIVDLILAAFTTLVFGVAALQSRSFFVGREGDVVSLLGAAIAIAAGPIYLWRRGRQPIIPIAAVYCVVMFFVLLAADFVVAFRRGQVDL